MTAKQTDYTVQHLLTKAVDKINTSRIGRICSWDLEQEALWVDYEANPFHKPLPAKLAVYDISFADLKQAVTHAHSVRLEFENGNPERPVIKDIYLSITKLKTAAPSSSLKEQVHIKADEIILEAESRIILKAGDVQTIYNAQAGTLITEATRIDTSATLTHKLKGGAVHVN
jgi:hypothetical protein